MITVTVVKFYDEVKKLQEDTENRERRLGRQPGEGDMAYDSSAENEQGRQYI